MPRRVASIAPLKRPQYDSQRIESRFLAWSLLASQRGQTRESGLDAIDAKDVLLTTTHVASFPQVMCLMSYSEEATPRTNESTLRQDKLSV
jgi:hypothetical protein